MLIINTKSLPGMSTCELNEFVADPVTSLRGAEVSRQGYTMTDWSRPFEDPITLPNS